MGQRSSGLARAIALTAACASIFAGSIGRASGQSAPPMVMKLAVATLNDPQHEYLRRFGAAVDRDSGGRIHSEIYPASQLGSMPRMIENTQFGAIQCWVGPMEFLSGVDPRFQVIGAPNLFSSPEQTQRVLLDPELNRTLLGLANDKGLRGIAVFYYGENYLDARKPVNRLAEFKGLKVRDYGGKLEDAMVSALGATAVPMPLDQTLTALNQGAIDGAFAAAYGVTPMKYYASAKYMVALRISTLVSFMACNRKWYESLPPDLKTVIDKDGADVARELLPYTVDYAKREQAEWDSNGGASIVWPAEDYKEAARRTAGVADATLRDQPGAYALLQQVRKVAARRLTR